MTGEDVTLDQVAAAAARLEADGGRATVEALREALDGGSIATLHRHLASWRASTAKPRELPKVELPESLVAALGSWARQYADDAGAGEREALAQSHSDMEPLLRSVEELESEREQLRETIERLTAELRNARLIATDALVGKAKDQLAIEGKDAQLLDLRAQIERNVTATAALSDARLAAEMELVGAVTARDNFAAEIQELRTQLDARRGGRG